MAKRHNRDIMVEYPWGTQVQVPADHRNDLNPSLINHTFVRALWITSEKFISDGVIEFHWVWATRDGEVKEQITATKEKLPAKWQKRLKV